jgi:hypothetical protein
MEESRCFIEKEVVKNVSDTKKQASIERSRQNFSKLHIQRLSWKNPDVLLKN